MVLPINTFINFVPQQEAWVIERFGKFNTILSPGLQILIPVIDQIKYVHSLKEVSLEVPPLSAITQDNVSIDVDAVLYIKVVDAYKASYGVDDGVKAVSLLAQTALRACIGRMSLDAALAERATLNKNVTDVVNSAAEKWGIECLRHEIKDIHPPSQIIEAMHFQLSAERKKRADILASEGERQAEINKAQGLKEAAVLRAEAVQAEIVLKAEAEAKAINMSADATAQAIRAISDALSSDPNSSNAVALTLAEKYIEAFGNIAKEGTTVIVGGEEGNISNVSSNVAKAMSIFETLKQSNK